MLSEKESGALRDMLRHVDLAEQFARGHSFESLRDDLQALYAIIRIWLQWRHKPQKNS
jgi:phenylalanyl-tRNA synthetase beta subunit